MGQDVQLGNRVAQNAIENNFIPMVVVYGVYAAGALWTAYEVYSVGRDQGVEAALQELALQGAIGVATGAAGKVVYKVGKVSYMSAAAAWKAYLAESPVMRAVIGQLGEWGAKVVNKAANAPAVKKAVNVAAAADKKAQGVAEKFIPKAVPANGASVGNANAKGAQQPASKQSVVAPKSTRQEGVPPQKTAPPVVTKQNKGEQSAKINPGRNGKQQKLKSLAKDDKLGGADKGWIKQEINHIKRGDRNNVRVPPGKQLAHKRGFEAAKGNGYDQSNLQDINLHKLQHKFDGMGKKNNSHKKKE